MLGRTLSLHRRLPSLAAGWTALAAPSAFAANVVLFALPVAADEALFNAPWRAFDVADFPEFAPVALDNGDIDGDGDIDIVAAREFWFSPGIAVLRNNGDGSYSQEELYHLSQGMDTRDVALEDIDSDGDLDAIVTIAGAGQDFRFAVWPNNGDGTFGARRLFDAGPGPIGLVVADFTGDGFPDVVTADYGYVGQNDTISIMRHNGQTGAQAGFLAPQSFVVGQFCEQLDVADVDGDGDLDLAVGRDVAQGGVNGVHILRNDGAGNFTVIGSYAAYQGAYRVSAAVKLDDMDNDGDVDLITAGAVSSPRAYAVIRYNDGTGDYPTQQTFQLSEWSFTPWALDTADLNDDGWRDLFLITPDGRSHDGWELLLSNGAGGYQPVKYHQTSKWAYDIKAFDADGDGDDDVATVANDASVVTVHNNPGNGDFYIPVRNPVQGLIHTGLESGDIDHDGDPDIVNAADRNLNVLVNNGDGTFQPAAQYQMPICIGDMRLRDMNNDGNDDAIMATHPNCPPYDFAVALGNGDGTFQPGIRIPVGGSQGGQINAFDLDNDGDLDIILTDPGASSRIFVAENLGNGTSYSLTVPIDMAGFYVEGSDFNHDGNMDFVSSTALGLTLFPGNGDLTFGDAIPTGEEAWKFKVADLDGDGNDDLAMMRPPDTFGTLSVAVSYGYGDGGFTFAVETPGPNGRESNYRISFDIDAADVNADGIGDIILTNTAPNDVSIFLGSADGGVIDQDRYGAGTGCQFSTVNDFDLDGVMDIASLISLDPGGFTDVVVVLKGTGADQGGGTTELIDVTMVTGTILSGSIDDLRASDDSNLHTRSGFGQTLIDLHHMEMVVGAVTTVDSPVSLDITIEARIDEQSGSARVRLFNWSTNEFDQVGQYPIGTTEESRAFEGIDAANYVSGSGEIDVSVKHIVFVPFLAFTFESFIDQIEILAGR